MRQVEFTLTVGEACATMLLNSMFEEPEQTVVGLLWDRKESSTTTWAFCKTLVNLLGAWPDNGPSEKQCDKLQKQV
jgi:hypothetical protein